MNLSLVYGYPFPINHSYATNHGEIDGWTFVYQILENILKNSKFTYKRFGNIQNPDSHGICLILHSIQTEAHVSYMNIKPDDLEYCIEETYNADLTEYHELLAKCDLTNIKAYKPCIHIISS
jgi:hypothetical protein